MIARDIMHADVVSVRPDDSVLDAVKVMLDRKISGLPVMDGGNLVGILTEGDLIRRSELQTGRHRSAFVEFFVGPGRLADEYVRMSSRKVHDVMTHDVHTVPETATLRDVVEVMDKQNVKRVPVVVSRAVIGMVTRADLMRALIAAGTSKPVTPLSDDEIRRRLIDHLQEQKWAAPDLIDITVKNGEVTLKGAVLDPRQIQAFEVAAENIPGVKKVNDRLVWIDPESGTAFDANNRIV